MADRDRFMPLEEWEAERMQDPGFVAALAAREPAYQVARLRILRDLTQKQLAELVGAKQSSMVVFPLVTTQPSVIASVVCEAIGIAAIPTMAEIALLRASQPQTTLLAMTG